MTKVPDQSSGAASSPASQMDIGRIEGRRVYHNNKSLAFLKVKQSFQTGVGVQGEIHIRSYVEFPLPPTQ